MAITLNQAKLMQILYNGIFAPKNGLYMVFVKLTYDKFIYYLVFGILKNKSDLVDLSWHSQCQRRRCPAGPDRPQVGRREGLPRCLPDRRHDLPAGDPHRERLVPG